MVSGYTNILFLLKLLSTSFSFHYLKQLLLVCCNVVLYFSHSFYND